MKYLLDTCIISELIKSKPNENVIAWIEACDEESFCLSALTLGEIHKGITKMPDSQKKEKIESWVEHELQKRFAGRILHITGDVAKIWGNIQGKAEQKGKKMPVIDSLIAATGLVHNLTVVTRNVSDMKISGVRLLNPWVKNILIR